MTKKAIFKSFEVDYLIITPKTTPKTITEFCENERPVTNISKNSQRLYLRWYNLGFKIFEPRSETQILIKKPIKNEECKTFSYHLVNEEFFKNNYQILENETTAT